MKTNQYRTENRRTVRSAFLPSLVVALALGLLSLPGSARADVVAHYTFDNTLNDSGPNGLALTTGAGGANYASGGKFGQALWCTNFVGGAGTGNYQYNSSSLFAFGTGNFAVAFWYQSDHTNGQDPFGIGGMVNKDSAATARSGWDVRLSGSTTVPVIAYEIKPTTTGKTFAMNAPDNDTNVWHHIVLQRRGDIMESWFDGVLTNSTSGVGGYNCSASGYAFAVGARGILTSGAYGSGGGYGLNGRIDELWVFNNVLSQAQIAGLVANNVVPQSNTLALASSPVSPSVVGSNVTFTATVQTNGATAGDATSTVVFKDGVTPLSTNTVSSGVATFSTSALGLGSHTIQAEYSGDTNYLASTNSMPYLVNAPLPATATALGSSPNPSLVGSNVVFTATVQTNGATAGNAGGTMVFSEGLTPLSTNNVAGGVGVYTNNTLAVGSHTITALYSGDSHYAGSFSGTVTQIVQLATTTALTLPFNSSVVGSSVTFTATVRTNGALAGGALGTVVFLNGGTPLSTNGLSSGVASFSTTNLPSGTNLITAQYSGDDYDLGSTSASLALLVLPEVPAGVIAHYTFDNTLNDSGAYALNLATGAGGANYAASGKFGQGLWCTNFPGGANTGNYQYNASPLFDFGTGDFAIAFWYQSDYTNGQNPFNTGVMVTKDDHLTTNPGWAARQTGATDAPLIGYTIEPAGANNTVDFTTTAPADGSTAWHHVVLQRNWDLMECWLDGVLIYSTNRVYNVNVSTPGYAFAVGARGVLSSGAFASGGGYGLNGRIDELWVVGVALNQAQIVGLMTNNVLPPPSTITLASSTNSPPEGSSVTFTATVQTNGATAANAGGTMAFKAGAVTLGSAEVTNGVATFTTSALPGGTTLITAVYAGDPNYLGSTSLAVTQVVRPWTATVIAALINPIMVGDYTYFEADVQTNGVVAGDAGGTMVFKEGATTLDSEPVSGGVAYSSFNTLTAGWHYITAEYSGDSFYLASTSSVPAAQAVASLDQTPTSTTLGSSLDPSTNGDSVTFTTTVSDSLADGTMVFKDGAVTLGSSGVTNGLAYFTTSALPVGTNSLTAEYSGNATDGPSPAALTQIVASSSSIQGNPRITSVQVAGGNVTLIGTNAPASYGRTYWLMMTNDVAAARAGWPAVATNVFAADGGFTNMVPVSGARQFYLIQVP